MANIAFNARHGISVGTSGVQISDDLGNITATTLQVGGKALTLGSTLSTVGTAITLNASGSGSSNVTLPATGTLATVNNDNNFSTIQTFGARVHTGKISSLGSQKLVNLAYLPTQGASIVGTIKISLGAAWTNTFGIYRIVGYDYITGHWEVIVSGYNYSPTPKWQNGSYEIKGSAPFSSVRLAHDGTNCCILLGETVTTNSYCSITLSEAYLSNSGITTLRDATQTISIIASEAGITNIYSPPQAKVTGASFNGLYISPSTGSLTIANGSSLITSGANSLTLTTTGATNITLPTTGTLATTAGTETLTNKIINGNNNTISNISNAALTNNSITIGSTAITLGSSATALGGLTSVTATTFNGTATYLSATQQTNIITGKTESLSMSQDAGATKGSFVCRATGTTDANLAGMTFYNNSYAIKMGVRSDGVFGIGGWSRPAWSWYSDSSGNMVAAGNVTAYSDPRLKDEFTRIEDPLGIIRSLTGGTFNWKYGIPHIENKAGKRDYGLDADEVEKVMPEIITESIEIEGVKYKTVCYEKLVPVLLEAIKKLEVEIELLKGNKV